MEATYTEKEMEDELSVIENREEILDTLSRRVAAFFGEDIGEHSNLNDPWKNAIDLLEGKTLAAERARAVRGALDEIEKVNVDGEYSAYSHTVEVKIQQLREGLTNG